MPRAGLRHAECAERAQANDIDAAVHGLVEDPLAAERQASLAVRQFIAGPPHQWLGRQQRELLGAQTDP